ncbi:MAG: hypothetical protein RIC19_05780 [Phaeodactylibacter sp.]|uniref:hypothetical protein n=1 Tax=Phaeodactylibacter sp. TaxID=1940289 RepID=UPI0032ED77CA
MKTLMLIALTLSLNVIGHTQQECLISYLQKLQEPKHIPAGVDSILTITYTTTSTSGQSAPDTTIDFNGESVALYLMSRGVEEIRSNDTIIRTMYNTNGQPSRSFTLTCREDGRIETETVRLLADGQRIVTEVTKVFDFDSENRPIKVLEDDQLALQISYRTKWIFDTLRTNNGMAIEKWVPKQHGDTITYKSVPEATGEFIGFEEELKAMMPPKTIILIQDKASGKIDYYSYENAMGSDEEQLMGYYQLNTDFQLLQHKSMDRTGSISLHYQDNLDNEGNILSRRDLVTDTTYPFRYNASGQLTESYFNGRKSLTTYQKGRKTSELFIYTNIGEIEAFTIYEYK